MSSPFPIPERLPEFMCGYHERRLTPVRELSVGPSDFDHPQGVTRERFVLVCAPCLYEKVMHRTPAYYHEREITQAQAVALGWKPFGE